MVPQFRSNGLAIILRLIEKKNIYFINVSFAKHKSIKIESKCSRPLFARSTPPSSERKFISRVYYPNARIDASIN